MSAGLINGKGFAGDVVGDLELAGDADRASLFVLPALEPGLGEFAVCGSVGGGMLGTGPALCDTIGGLFRDGRGAPGRPARGGGPESMLEAVIALCGVCEIGKARDSAAVRSNKPPAEAGPVGVDTAREV